MIVVIVDDNLPHRELMRELLEIDGHVVHEAAGGTEAIALVRAENPAIVFLDLRMPVLDGFGVLDALRCDPAYSRLPVIAVSACAMQGDRERAIQAGFDSYITKPFDLAELRKEVRIARASTALVA